MEEIGLSEHEAQLRGEFVRLAEYQVADWATQNLAVVIHRTGEWSNRSAEDYRRRAIVLLTIRLLRAIRAGMAVHAIGWEVEGRSLDRLAAEARARLMQVSDDQTDETGRLWLERKLAEKSSIKRGTVGGDIVAMETHDGERSAVGLAPLVFGLGLYVSSEAQGWPEKHTIDAIFNEAAAV